MQLKLRLAAEMEVEIASSDVAAEICRNELSQMILRAALARMQPGSKYCFNFPPEYHISYRCDIVFTAIAIVNRSHVLQSTARMIPNLLHATLVQGMSPCCLKEDCSCSGLRLFGCWGRALLVNRDPNQDILAYNQARDSFH